MKLLILYKTKHGSTEQYAQWIAEEVNAEISDVEKFNKDNLDNYDAIIIGSPTYMGQIQMKDFIEQNWEVLKNKNIYLFNVGMFPWEHPDSQKSFEMIPEPIRDKIEFSKLPGHLDTKKLNLFEKVIAKTVKARSEENISRDNIAPIVKWAKKMS
jgi:menaquinone-dependent protoporphyrinogen IX oxidase